MLRQRSGRETAREPVDKILFREAQAFVTALHELATKQKPSTVKMFRRDIGGFVVERLPLFKRIHAQFLEQFEELDGISVASLGGKVFA